MSSTVELSRREREVAKLVALGLTNRQIADRLFIAERTAEGHVEQIRNKLGFTSRSQIAVWVVAGTGDQRDRAAERKRRNNLPTPLGDLVGRDKETDELAKLVARKRGVVTLTGPGGVGKTRLAIAAAARLLDEFPDGVWFVDLAPLRDPNHIATSVARTLGLQPVAGGPLVATIAASLDGRTALLVLDNFEHLVRAGSLLTELLEKSPKSAAMVTSREVLRLYREQEYPVPSLAIGNESQPGPAVQLFIERARETLPKADFEPSDLSAIKAICERLDGLPLAIELAAARVRVLSPAAMLVRLGRSLELLTSSARNVPTRHQALAATFAWSHELLTEEERTLFRRLAVFTGGCTLEAAETVCAGGGLVRDRIIDLVDSLVAKSLLRREQTPGGARFRMLETVHEFARARLEAAPEASEMKLGHMRYFRDLAEREAPLLKSDNELLALGRLDADLDNLRAAIERSHTSGDGESELRTIAGLWFYWNVRGETKEGLDWLSAAPVDDERIHPDVRAEAMVGDGRLRLTNGDMDGAAKAGRRLQALASLCSVPGRYLGWSALLIASEAGKEPKRIRSLAADGLRLMTQFGDWWERALATTFVGEVERMFGSPVTAAEAYQSAIRLLEDHGGERFLTAVNRYNLGQTSLLIGDLRAAESNFRQALAAQHQVRSLDVGLNAVFAVIGAIGGLAAVAHARGRPGQAARLLGVADEALARIGYKQQPADQTPRDQLETTLRATLGEATYEELHAEGARLAPGEAVAAYGTLEDADAPDAGLPERSASDSR